MESVIEFEITSERVPYEYTKELIQKICEDHEGKRDLHIKVNLIDTYSLKDDSLSDIRVS